MIFSRNKVPTKPGMYWMLRWGVLKIVRVFSGSPDKTLYWDLGEELQEFEDVAHPGVLWGDRIEIPTVEEE